MVRNRLVTILLLWLLILFGRAGRALGSGADSKVHVLALAARLAPEDQNETLRSVYLVSNEPVQDRRGFTGLTFSQRSGFVWWR